MWDNPRRSYTAHHYPKACAHCWVWVKRNVNWETEEGERFIGDYLTMECGHCRKMGKITCRWNDALHSHIPEGSKRGFYNVHNTLGCPPRGGKSKSSELEYADDF